MTTNELGQEILFEHRKRYGSIEFVAFHGKRNFAITVRDNHDELAKYLGLGDQADILALGKAIVSAMEPEALVENQKPAEPEPIKDGDWVLVAEDSPYNEHYRGKVLQVIEAEWSGSPDFVLLRSEDGNRGAIRARWVTPASAPTPTQDYDIPALVAAVAALEDRVADLEVAADPEIRVGDTVRVEPDDWNIGGAWCGYETLVGEVVWVASVGKEWGSRYRVKVTPSRGADAGTSQRIYATKATKVVSRG